MAKAISSGKSKSEREDEQKTRKKQAKKEAKLMLQVEQSKKDVSKAEKKANKAQTVLQDLRAQLQKLEGELIQFRNGGQQATTEAETAETATSAASTDLQASSLPDEGRDDIDAPGATSSEATTTAEADHVEVQPFSPPPVEDRSDRAQGEAISPPVETANTPIENIPTEQSDETIGAQVHADISINPAPTEEDLTINSGDGSIPVVTNDENAWPPPEIREELAESIAQDVAQGATQEPSPASHSETNEEVAPDQAAVGNENGAAEENFAIVSGDGSIPVVTNDENAWPPPQIREELAESIAQDVAQEHATDNNEQSEADDAENHDIEHEASRSRRSTRRKTRSSTQQHTNNQE